MNLEKRIEENYFTQFTSLLILQDSPIRAIPELYSKTVQISNNSKNLSVKPVKINENWIYRKGKLSKRLKSNEKKIIFPIFEVNMLFI